MDGPGHQAHELLPAVHRIAAPVKRWIGSTQLIKVATSTPPATYRDNAQGPVTDLLRGFRTADSVYFYAAVAGC